MRLTINLAIALLVFMFYVPVRADSWVDPTWENMLDDSDVIALVEYRSNGDYRAKASIEMVYKGEVVIGEEIWISGFSNRYGPFDKKEIGERYLVFLNLNEPSKKNLEYWDEEIEKDLSLKDYVEALKHKKAYNVWSPTSGALKIKGNKVQYDLTQTTYYYRQSFHSFDNFESFLHAYINNSGFENVIQKNLASISLVRENDARTQSIMQLYYLGYNKFHNVFEEYSHVKNSSTKYAIAMLMGNIRNENSRNILISLLDDNNGIVQGEAVRQLKKESPLIVAPILLTKLKSSSNENFGPSGLMDPVLNTVDGGKIEIIRALGELKYEPAVPDLLSLLDTNDDKLFKLVIETLKQIGTKEYITYLNKHLDDKNYNLIFAISMMIANDSLEECIPSFQNFISTCDRNRHPSMEYVISTCCGIGKFKDSSNIDFLISDLEHFFTYCDTLESSYEEEWLMAYFKTFTNLKNEEVRPLLLKAFFDWFGINEAFGENPELFEIKEQAEDSLKGLFEQRLGSDDCKINYCIAYIENIPEVLIGQKPKFKFLIEVSIPISWSGEKQKSIISDELNIAKENVYIRFSNGWYHVDNQKRFSNRISSTVFMSYLDYAKAVPNSKDLMLLREIINKRFVNNEYVKKKIDDAIEEIQEKLEK